MGFGLAALLGGFLVAGCCPKRPIQPPPMTSCQRPATRSAQRIPLGLKLQLVSGRTRKPASVRMLFRAKVLGRPFSGLRAADLVLSEETVAARQPLGKPTLIPLGAAAMTQTLLLVDLTGEQRVIGNRRLLLKRLRTVVRRLLGTQAVGLAVFDGGAEIRVLQSFTRDPVKLETALKKLPSLKARDPSRNLNGAVAAALGEIELYGAQAGARFELSSLVVFTSGPDLADRKEAAELRRMLGSHHRQGTQLFAVGLGPWAGAPVLRSIGKTATFPFKALSKFDDAAAKRIAHVIRNHVEGHYVLFHCSSRRQGNHRLVLGVRGRQTSITHDYDAHGFTGGCDTGKLVRSCKTIQCGGPAGTQCYGCDEGKLCYRNRCLPSYLAKEFHAEDRARKRSAAVAARKARAARVRGFNRCQARRSTQQRQWRSYRLHKQRFDEADCGFRALVELGSRAYPAPKGVATAVLAGWSMGRWLEVHGGAGFSSLHAVGLVQARVKLFRWRILDLMLVPRFGVGGSKKTLLINAEVLFGVRLRLGRYFGLSANIGPGYGFAREHGPGVTRQNFVLPFWLGAELRL